MANPESKRLAIDVIARVDKLEKELRKGSKAANDNFSKIEDRGKRMSARLEADIGGAAGRVGGLLKNFGAGLLGGAGGLTGLAAAAGAVAKSVASVGDAAKRAGLSTTAFQELAAVAKANRIEVDALTDGMKELALRADEFITTGAGSSAEAFQRLGYDATTLKEKLKDPSALFTEIIGKLGQLDKAAQIRIADEVFGGTGGEKFVQLISQGEAGIRKQIKAAHDMGQVLDADVIKRADEIDKKFNAISATVAGWVQPKVISFLDDVLGLLDRIKPLEVRMDSTINEDLADLGKQRLELERRRIDIDTRQARGDRGMGDGVLGFGETDFGTARQELQRDSEALAENERRIMDVVKARQAENKAMSETPIAEDRATRARGEDAFILPDTVGETPTRRTDPYFADAQADEAGKKVGESAAVELVKKFEGFISKAKWDVNHFRVGFGSDTMTDAAGRISKVTAESVTSLEGANRDLARRIAEFQGAIQNTIGSDVWRSFSEEQQAALTSVAYNYGSLPDRIVAAIESGNPEKIGIAIRDLGDDNDGINRKRRSAEADLFLSGSGSGNTPAIEAAEAHKAAIDDLQASYESLADIGVGAAKSLANALADGKLEASELVAILADVAQQLLSMPAFPTAGGTGGGGSLGGSILSALLGGLGGGGSDPWAGLRLAGGGRVRGPGGPTGDKIPAMLSDGEHVTRSAMVRKHGALLDAINADRVPHLVDGGLVGAMPRISTPAIPQRAVTSQEVTLRVIGEEGPMFRPTIQAESQGVAVRVVRQGIGQYDREAKRAFPKRMAEAQIRDF
ncbi:glycoside hydrolase family protein [Mesorhizobium yinganensis]|uniref:glycoside hydrolase family protein n=1 Tax=Mesorhizobium yinganensis TaxID=3157707 RepID=UPI0032B7C189